MVDLLISTGMRAAVAAQYIGKIYVARQVALAGVETAFETAFMKLVFPNTKFDSEDIQRTFLTNSLINISTGGLSSSIKALRLVKFFGEILIATTSDVFLGGENALKSLVSNTVGQFGGRIAELYGGRLIKNLLKDPKPWRRALGEGLDDWCFAPDTLVDTEHGQKRIADIKTDENVYAFNYDGGDWELARVAKHHKNVYSRTVPKLIRI